MSTENILEVRGLNKYFGPTHANRDINFTVKKGEIKGLIGENGSESPSSRRLRGLPVGFRRNALKRRAVLPQKSH